MDETQVKILVAEAIAEYEKKRATNSIFNNVKSFVVKHFQTICIVALLFYSLGGISGGIKLFENVIGKMFDVQVNNALIQRIIPDGEDRTRFVDRIKKLFDQEYANDDQFESDYRQTTADFRYKYPQLREHSIRSKEQLADFLKGG